jgi:hypothetical protein
MKEDTYLAGQIERALHGDPRTRRLGIRVEVNGDDVVLRGQVASEEGRLLIAQIAGQQAPGLPVRNEVSTTEMLPPAVSDVLPLPEETLPAREVPPPRRAWS